MRKQYIGYEKVAPGAFYQGCFPGGFSDSVTGIHVPGPIVFVNNEAERMITGVASLPDPVQMPHVKLVLDFIDKDRKDRKWIEAPFDRQDTAPLHEALALALGTGIIRELPDEEVERRYPDAWAKRSSHLVFDPNANRDETPMRDLIAEHEKVMDAKAAISNIGKGKITVPPPSRA